ncbi:MAG: DNA polymerase III subunit delta [Bacteroidota bacterium]|jgi:DNA polymerase-3 subunit delta
MATTFKEIMNDLKRKIYRPVYFLCGEEPYFIDKISEQIENNVIPEEEQGFNLNILYGKETSMETVLNYARQFPMMGERQVVIVKEAQNLKEFSARGGKDGDDENESADTKSDKSESPTKAALQSYLENPVSSTILVFCHKYKKPDKRQKLGKTLTSKTVYFESDKLRDWDMPKFIAGMVSDMNLKANERVCHMLSEYLGSDIGKIENELEKLKINLPAGAEVTMQHIQENIGISKEYNIFELQDAIESKDVLKANRIINYFNANPKDHFISMTLGFLYGYFVKVMMVHFCQDRSKMGIAKSLGISPYFADKYDRAARNYNTAKLKSIFSYLREADIRSKGIDNAGTTHAELQRELIFKILH